MRKGKYGFDAPHVPLLMGAGALVFLVGGVAASVPALVVSGLFLLLSTASYLFTTRVGKFSVWKELLDRLQLRGDEQVLDMGCGRGAVLLMAAEHLPTGQAVGVDLWRRVDQSGNSEQTTLRNATLEGVAERIALHTADMTALPFEHATFDVVLSGLALHNIKPWLERQKGVDEAARVLRPGGRLIIVDIGATKRYARRLEDLGMTGVSHHGLGWRGWFGGPWVSCKLVAATKPEQADHP